jgi:hypothetical protein
MRTIALFAGVVLLLTGCGPIIRTEELHTALADEGYDLTNVVVYDQELVVEVVLPGEVPTQADGEAVAELVWTTYDEEFEQLRVIANAETMLLSNANDLAQRFGERPAGLGEDSARSMNVTALAIILAVTSGFAGLLVWIWHLSRRSSPGPGYPRPPRHRRSQSGTSRHRTSTLR